MLRLSKLTDYATLLLATMTGDRGAPIAAPAHYTAGQLAKQCQLNTPTVSKLLKKLQRAGIVESTRGLHGGYKLARPAHQISAAAILDALEGPVAITECATTHSRCGLQANCRVGGSWQRISIAIRQSLEEITLAELAGLESNSKRFALFDLRLRNGVAAGSIRNTVTRS